MANRYRGVDALKKAPAKSKTTKSKKAPPKVKYKPLIKKTK